MKSSSCDSSYLQGLCMHPCSCPERDTICWSALHPCSNLLLAHMGVCTKKSIRLLTAAAAIVWWQRARSFSSCQCIVYLELCSCVAEAPLPVLQSRNAEEALRTIKSVSTDLLAAQHAILSITSSSNFARRRSFSQPYGSHLHAAAGQSQAFSAGVLARCIACVLVQVSGETLHGVLPVPR